MNSVSGRTMLEKMQYVVFRTWLPDDFLRKVDAMSMAHSLECRCPFLDYRVMEFAARLPFAAKFDERGCGKRILRAVLSRYLPSALFDRPKQGFSIPWDSWFDRVSMHKCHEQWACHAPIPFGSQSAALIFPNDQEGSRFLMWLAYVTLQQQEVGSDE